MKLLITTPFFNNLGGTELEIIHTANSLAREPEVDKLEIFTAGKIDLKFTSDIYLNNKIEFKSYPFWFNYHFIRNNQKKIAKIFKSDFLILENLYWKLFFLRNYKSVYIITKSSLDYYYPIVRNFKKKDKIFLKYTTIFFEDMPRVKKEILKICAYNIVTSFKQENFFKNRLGLKNTISQEVILHNESFAIAQVKDRSKSRYDFGVVTRFSPEKQLEDAVQVILELRNLGFKKSLVLIGGGDLDYFNRIKKKVELHHLKDQIYLKFCAVPYDRVYEKFHLFNCFLITSKFEGGPNIALELMAFGLPMVSYKVGAMEDRLLNFPQLLADNINQMVQKALEITNLNEEKYSNLAKDLKMEYINHKSNSKKTAFLKENLIRK